MRVFGLVRHEELGPEERSRMKKLMRDLFMSWQTWFFVMSICLVVIGIFSMAMQSQRREYQRMVDQSAIRMLQEIRHDIDTLRIQNDTALKAQHEIRKDVDEVREAVSK